MEPVVTHTFNPIPKGRGFWQDLQNHYFGPKAIEFDDKNVSHSMQTTARILVLPGFLSVCGVSLYWAIWSIAALLGWMQGPAGQQPAELGAVFNAFFFQLMIGMTVASAYCMLIVTRENKAHRLSFTWF